MLNRELVVFEQMSVLLARLGFTLNRISSRAFGIIAGFAARATPTAVFGPKWLARAVCLVSNSLWV